MATPEFIVELRHVVGHRLLWLPGITAVVLRGAPGSEEVLLVKRSDNGAWTPVGGIVEPGEEPWATAVRETLEETSVVCEVEGLAAVSVEAPGAFPNGDEVQFLNHTFRCRWVSGQPFPADDESSEAAFFSVTGLPVLAPKLIARIEAALQFDGVTGLVSGLES